MQTLAELIRQNAIETKRADIWTERLAGALHAISNYVWFSDGKTWRDTDKKLFFIERVKLILNAEDPFRAIYEDEKRRYADYHARNGTYFMDFDSWQTDEEGYHAQVQIALVKSLSTGLLNPFNYKSKP